MQNKDSSEFKTMKKATGNHLTIFPKKSEQFAHNKENESVESHDCLHPEETRHIEQDGEEELQLKEWLINSALRIKTYKLSKPDAKM